MDRGAVLPDRCVACNTPAGNYRIKRTLYCSPLAWRIAAFVAPFALTALGIYLDETLLTMSFMLLPLPLLIVHVFVRRSFKIEFGICARHRLMRRGFIAISMLCIGGVFAGIVTFGDGASAILLLLGSIIGLLIFIGVQSYFGAQAIGLQSVSVDYVWLSGTGERFRSTLPELN